MVFLPELHVRQAEPPADDPAVAEGALDFVWVRRRRDVEILGVTVEQQVTDAAPDQKGRVIELAQAVQHLQRVGVDVLAGDRVIGP